MGKFCLPAVSLCSQLRLLGYLILVGLAVIPAQAASNQATAVLRIRITVVPTVEMTAAQPATTSSAGTVSYNLQPSSTPKMSTQVTVQQIPGKSLPNDSSRSTGQSGKDAVLQTTTIIPE